MGSSGRTHFVPSGRRSGEPAFSYLGFLVLIAVIVYANATALHDMQANAKGAGSGASRATNSAKNVSRACIGLDLLQNWGLITSKMQNVRPPSTWKFGRAMMARRGSPCDSRPYREGAAQR